MRNRPFVLFSFGLISLSTLVLQHNPSLIAQRRRAAVPKMSQARLVEAYGKLPLSFEANQGQTGSEVKFLSRGSGYSLFLTANEAVLSLKPSRDRKGAVTPVRLQNKSGPLANARGSDRAAEPDQATPEPSVLRMKLVGANPSPQVAGLDELPGKSNYFIGNDPAKWRTNIPTYAKVKYEEVYPGIDLVYYGNQRQLEYDFVVAPGAKPDSIRFEIAGAEKIETSADGELLVQSGGAEILLRKPLVYQEADGKRQELSGNYQLRSPNEIRFELAAYDATKPVVIDPVVVYATYLGGSDSDQAAGIAVDSQGSAYVTGYTTSFDFPTANPFQGKFNGSIGFTGNPFDVFVSKLTADGSALVYSTYLGGSDSDKASGIAVDAAGNAYVTGNTASANFPTTSGAFQPSLPGRSNPTFVTKLNSTGSALSYSTYLGVGDSRGNGIAVDSSGNAYVTGTAFGGSFPATPGAFRTTCFGTSAFVTKFNAAGSALVYSTCLGSGGTEATGIAVDSSGSAYVTGFTPLTSFPTTPGAVQVVFGGAGPSGANDAFVTKLNPAGSALVFSTYLGGNGNDQANGIAIDSSGNVYVAGITSSGNFPLQNAFQSTPGGGSYDAFVARLNATGTALLYSSFLGGNGVDIGTGIAVDSGGNAFVAGRTISANFPSVNSLTSRLRGVFITKVTSTGSIVYSGPLGNVDTGGSPAIAVDTSGSAYASGSASEGVDTTPGAFQRAAAAGSSDAFVVKVADIAPPPNPVPAVTSLSPATAVSGGAAFILTVTGTNFVPGATVQWNGSNRSTTFVSATQLTAAITASDIASAGTAQVSVFNPAPGGGASNALTFTIAAAVSNPTPILNSLTPSTALPGSPAFTLTLTGSNFISGATVQWNGSNRSTTFLSGTQLTAAIAASDIATAGTAQVTVFNPAPGGGFSNALSFSISTPGSNPVPVITSLSTPAPVLAAIGYLMTVSGSNFVAGSVVQWNGSSRPTTFVSATQLTASLTAADVQAGTAQVTVFNPAPGGGVSNALTFSGGAPGSNPVPVLISLTTPTVLPAGIGYLMTVFGSNFVTGSFVQWNGSSRTTTYVSATQLTVQLTVADVSAGGTAQVTVFNPAPGGGVSNAVTYPTVVVPNPTPAISLLSPNSAVAGGGAFGFAVNGSNFIAGSVVRWNGNNRSTTFVSGTQLIASIAAADIATAGTAQVTVFNPAPGGGSSNAQTFTINPPSPPTVTEPQGTVSLSTNPAADCPGFYIAEVNLRPGYSGGYWGLEILLTAGDRLLQGGINLGGEFAADGGNPGFAAFNIANPANEPQNVSINLNAQVLPTTGFSAANFGMSVQIYQQVGTARTAVGAPIVGLPPFSVTRTLGPGFYVVAIQSFTGSPAGTYQLSLTTSFTNRSGGGFQGGVDLGGMLIPDASGNTAPGFGAFCISQAQNVILKTGAANTYPGGAGAVTLRVLDQNHRVVWDADTSPSAP